MGLWSRLNKALGVTVPGPLPQQYTDREWFDKMAREWQFIPNHLVDRDVLITTFRGHMEASRSGLFPQSVLEILRNKNKPLRECFIEIRSHLDNEKLWTD